MHANGSLWITSYHADWKNCDGLSGSKMSQRIHLKGWKKLVCTQPGLQEDREQNSVSPLVH